jgi:hypothetical protein
MRVLLDEMMSSRLARELVGHEVSTVPREGWAGLTNGALLARIDALFDVLVTMDRGMRYQQRVTGRPFGIIEVHARSNALRALLPAVPRIREAIDTIQPGDVVTIPVVADVRDPGTPPQGPASTPTDG